MTPQALAGSTFRPRISWMLPVLLGWLGLLIGPPAWAQAPTGCQALAAQYAVAPAQLDPDSLVMLATCITGELATRIGPSPEAEPDQASPGTGGEPRQAATPSPPPIPANVFPSLPVPSPAITAPPFPDQVAGGATPSGPQQYLGQWPPAASWSRWPETAWGSTSAR